MSSFNPYDTSRGEAQARVDELCDLARQAQALEEQNAQKAAELERLHAQTMAAIEQMQQHLANLTQDRERLYTALGALLEWAGQQGGWEAACWTEAGAAYALSLDLQQQDPWAAELRAKLGLVSAPCPCGSLQAKDRGQVRCCDRCWEIACALELLEHPDTTQATALARRNIEEAKRYLQIALSFRLSRG